MLKHGIDTERLNNPDDEDIFTECKRIYGYYKITKNADEPIEFDSYTHVLSRRINTQEARLDVSKGIVSLYFDMPYANTISNYIICNYDLASSNYTNKFTLKFTQRKDMGIKRITNDEDYNVLTCGGDVAIIVNGTEYTLEDVLNQKIITKNDLYAQSIVDLRYHLCGLGYYTDGGSMEFYYSELDEKNEGYTILKINSLDGNKDIYIGPKGELLRYITN